MTEEGGWSRFLQNAIIINANHIMSSTVFAYLAG